MDYPTSFNKLLAGHTKLTRALAHQEELASKLSPIIFNCLSDDWGNEIELVFNDEQEIIILVNSPTRATKLRFILPAIKSAVTDSIGKETTILIKIATNHPIGKTWESDNSMGKRSIGSRESSNVVSEAAFNLENEALTDSLKRLAKNLGRKTEESGEA